MSNLPPGAASALARRDAEQAAWEQYAERHLEAARDWLAQDMTERATCDYEISPAGKTLVEAGARLCVRELDVNYVLEVARQERVIPYFDGDES